MVLAVAEEADLSGKSREMRLGLVMYGGVSLAVYISGVAQEFARIVRGQGLYRLLKALTDSDVIVDIVSGTSAGGINGITLSYALCNSRGLEPVSDLWRQRADILPMLRSPFESGLPPRSVLNSEGYYQPKLREAFDKLSATPWTPEPGDDPSDFPELDLFITGTDLDGTHYTDFDDAGHPIDVMDHRQVFWLKHRKGRKEPFNPAANPDATHEALATLARLTSAFPAAFTPVYVGAAAPADTSAEAKLHLWGGIGGDKDAYFLDGGVLDNHPFTYTIEAIFSRSADREVVRRLFYVEPDPSEVKPQAAEAQPNFLQTILAALIGIPDYQSIASDLKLLADHNSKLEEYNRLVADLQKTLFSIAAGGASGGLEPLPTHMQSFYYRSRLVAISERVVQGVLKQNGRPVVIPPADRARAGQLTSTFDTLLATPALQGKIFSDFDVYFRQRRLQRLIYAIYDLLYDRNSTAQLSAEQAAQYQRALSLLNKHLDAYGIVQVAMEELIDDLPTDWRNHGPAEIWLHVQSALTQLLDYRAGGGTPVTDRYLPALLAGDMAATAAALSSLNRELNAASDSIVAAASAKGLPAPAPGSNLLLDLESCEQQLLSDLIPVSDVYLRPTYDQFEHLDAILYPLDLVGNLKEKDVIQTIRISPRDAQLGFSQLGFSDKVAGKALYHFGSFFKRSWRANDILWGRLDGLCELVETLLTLDRVQEIGNDDRWRARVRARFIPGGSQGGAWQPALDPAMLFPHAGAQTHERCRQWLAALLDDNEAVRAAALDPQVFADMVELLIEGEQLEVIYAELPSVITDALEEQAAWNSFQVEAGPGGAQPPASVSPSRSQSVGGSTAAAGLPWVFSPISGKTLDPFVAIVSSAQRVRDAMERFAGNDSAASRPENTSLGQFFRASYNVGSEEILRDIPTPVLLQILATSLLLMRNCVLGVFSPSAQAAVRRNLLYRLALDYPLRIFYGLVLLWRRGPQSVLALLLGLGVLAILTLLVGLYFRDQIIWVNGHISLTWLFVFIVAPVVVLILETMFLLSYRKFGRTA